MKDKNRDLVVKLLVFVIIALIAGFAATVVIMIVQNNVNRMILEEMKNNYNNEIVEIKTEEEQFVEYFLDSLMYYADNGYIYKLDYENEKLTVEDINELEDTYVEKLAGVLDDPYIVTEKYRKQDDKYFVYDMENIMQKLGLGYKNVGITDTNGKKLYVLGEPFNVFKEKFEDIRWIEDRAIYFGYNTNKFVEKILDLIEKYAGNGHIYKSKNGMIAIDRLTLIEAKNNRQAYKNIINSIINDREIFEEIYFENETLNCKYNFEYVLSALKLNSDLGKGIEVDEQGYKIYAW